MRQPLTRRAALAALGFAFTLQLHAELIAESGAGRIIKVDKAASFNAR